MNHLHTMKNPWAVSKTTVQCQHCNGVFPAQRINCIDTMVWPEGRQMLNECRFFQWVCPQCQNDTELAYPSRYIDKEYGIAAVLVPSINQQDPDEFLTSINRYMDRLALDGMEHRVVDNFYAMAEQMRIHQLHRNDRAIQLLKPLIIGRLQSQGFEVWNGFFMGLAHPEGTQPMEDTIYLSTTGNEADVYNEDIYQFHIYLTNGNIIPCGINDTAYQIGLNILDSKGLIDDDGQFHIYDLSWAIDIHNNLERV